MINSDNHGETFKGAIHFVAALQVAVMGAYNVLRFIEDRKVRNAVYAGIYAGAVVFEARNTWGHWRDAS